MYDYLLVGSGLFNAVFARRAIDAGKSCLVVEARKHIGGNCYTETIEGIHVHTYGAHIFRTSDKGVWEFVNQYAEFNNFINTPIANYNGELYNMPFNMNTFSKMWGITTPAEAQSIIDSQKSEIQGEPRNLEEKAISLVGRDVYEKLIKGYTEKQWGRDCKDLPASIIRRLPVRFTFNNNYYRDRYQGVPIGGFTAMFEKLFAGADMVLSTDYNAHREELNAQAKRVIYTGPIDAYFGYCYGPLEYRSLRFETKVLDMENYQGVAVMNFTDRETPYTRIIEHKHFEFGTQEKTVISFEYPSEWDMSKEPFYPINDSKNQAQYDQYRTLGAKEDKVRFGGRLGEYRYYDMQDTILSAFACADEELS